MIFYVGTGFFCFVTIHAFDGRTDRRTYISLMAKTALDRCSAMKMVTFILTYSVSLLIIIIIIIMWLVQSWTLPFVRACSISVDSALGGRRLLAQC